MVMQLLENWPLVVLAQLLGVFVAWSVDEISWELRRDEDKVYAFNLVSLFFCSFLAIVECLSDISLPMFGEILITVFLWLAGLTWVQLRQFKAPLRDTFLGLYAQLLCFVAASMGSALLALPVYAAARAIVAAPVPLGFGLFATIWIGSGAVIYALLSLFRPTIRGAWQTWLQNFRHLRHEAENSAK